MIFARTPDANEPWKKVRPAQAKALKKKLSKDSGGTVDISEDKLGRMLAVDEAV